MADKILGRSTFGRFNLELVESRGARGWKAKAKVFSDAEIEELYKSARDWETPGYKVIDIPKGFYRLPSVVEGIPVTNFKSCFVDVTSQFYHLKPRLRIENINLMEVDFSEAVTCEKMFSCKIFAATKRVDLDWTKMKRLKSSASMFAGCERLEYVDLTGAEFSSLESADSMFNWCGRLKYIGDVTTIRFPKLAEADYMFYNCLNLAVNMDLSNAELKKLVSASKMFYQCERLSAVHMPVNDNYVNLSEFVTRCWSLKELDLSMMKSTVTKINGLCTGCASLKRLKLPRIETYSAESRLSGFCKCCGELETIESFGRFEGIPVEIVSTYGELFEGCDNLKEADLRFLGDIDLGKVSIPSKYATIVHCTSGAKTPENAVELSQVDEKVQQTLSKLKRLTGQTQMIVIRHNDSLYDSVEEAEQISGKMQPVKIDINFKNTLCVDVAGIKAPTVEGMIQIASKYDFIEILYVLGMCLQKNCKAKHSILFDIKFSDSIDPESFMETEQYKAFLAELKSLDDKQNYVFYTKSMTDHLPSTACVYEKKASGRKRGRR